MFAQTRKETIADILFKDGRPILEIEINYPVAEGQITKEFERIFNSHYRRTAESANLSARTRIYSDALAAYASTKRQGLPFYMFSVRHTFQTTYISEKYISLCTYRSTYTGGAHGYTDMKGEVWSLELMRRVPLSELCGEKKPKADFLEKVRQAIADDKSGKFFPQAIKTAEKTFDPQNFYLTDSGIALFYPTYTLAPYYAGIQTFETGIQPR